MKLVDTCIVMRDQAVKRAEKDSLLISMHEYSEHRSMYVVCRKLTA